MSKESEVGNEVINLDSTTSPKDKKPKAPKKDESNLPYHQTSKGKRELQKLHDIGEPDPKYKRVPSGNGWKFIPVEDYEKDQRKYDFAMKVCEVNIDKKVPKQVSKKQVETSDDSDKETPKEAPKEVPQKISKKATKKPKEPTVETKQETQTKQLPNQFVSREEFEYEKLKRKKLKDKIRKIKNDFYTYEDVPLVDSLEPQPELIPVTDHALTVNQKPIGANRFAAISKRTL